MNNPLLSRRLARFLIYWPILSLPLILGSARPFLWSFAASVFLAAFAFYILISTEPGGGILSHATPRFPLPASRSLLLVILAYPFLQVVPLPLPLVSALSPQRAEWLHRSFEATGMSHKWACISYVPVDTFMNGLWLLTLALFALILHRSMRDGTIDPDRFLMVLFSVAGLEALYGIIQAMVPSMGLGFTEGATGTFASRNHYSAFLGMIWPLLLAWLQGPVDKKATHGPRVTGSYSDRERLRKAREKRLFFVFLTGIILLGIVLSRSRGGIICMVIGTTVLALLGVRRRKSIIPVLIGCWAIILAYGSVIGLEGIARRFTEIGHDAPGRFIFWQYTWRLICDHWLTGTGAGTYPPVIFLYQIFDTDLLQVGHAHNDYLEIAAEWGLPFSLLLFSLVWGYWVVSAGRLVRISNRSFAHSGDSERNGLSPGAREQRAMETSNLIRVGALAGSATFLSHILVEFNWQIPANQLYFVTLLVLMGPWEKPAIGCNEAVTREQAKPTEHPRDSGRFGRRDSAHNSKRRNLFSAFSASLR